MRDYYTITIDEITPSCHVWIEFKAGERTMWKKEDAGGSLTVVTSIKPDDLGGKE